MSATDHWFRFNVGDYLADTLHFTSLQHGIYILLLLHAYKHGGQIPGSPAELARIARIENNFTRRLMAPVLGLFERHPMGGYSHKRVLQELEHAKTISAMGKHAAAHRWSQGNGHADRNTHRNADRYANQEPELEPEDSPPRGPPSQGGKRAPRQKSRNAAIDIIREEMEARSREH